MRAFASCCAIVVLSAGCAAYPVYQPVLVQAALPSEADQQAVKDLDLVFTFQGILEKKEAGAVAPPTPVVKVGMRIRNRAQQPVKLTFGDFYYRDAHDKRFPLSSAFSAGKLLSDQVLAQGSTSAFDLYFDLTPRYVFGASFQIDWKFARATVSVPVYTQFAKVVRPAYPAPYPVYYDPWFPGPYYGYPSPYYCYPPRPHYAGPAYGFSYGYQWHRRH